MQESTKAVKYLGYYKKLEEKIQDVGGHPEVIVCKAFGMSTLLDYLPQYVSKLVPKESRYIIFIIIIIIL